MQVETGEKKGFFATLLSNHNSYLARFLVTITMIGLIMVSIPLLFWYSNQWLLFCMCLAGSVFVVFGQQIGA